jgi:DNA-binding NtrC family response regulator
MHILVASSSAFRQAMYREAVESLGHQVSVAPGGVECAARLRERRPDVLILEAPLFWGGAEGVLQVVESELATHCMPVILVAVGTGSIDWLALSRFNIDNFLFRVPTAQELNQAVSRVCSERVGQSNARPTDREEAALV